MRPPRTRKISFHLNEEIYQATRILAREQGYKNLSRFWQGLGILAVQDWRRRIWVKDLSNSDPTTRDYLIRQMLKFPLDAKDMLKVVRRLDDNEPPKKI